MQANAARYAQSILLGRCVVIVFSELAYVIISEERPYEQ